MGRLVHGEILSHLRAVGARVRFRRVRGILALFAGVSFIHGDLQKKTTGHLIEDRRIPLFRHIFSTSLRKQSRFSAEIDEFSLFRQAEDGSLPARFEKCGLGGVLRFDSSSSDVAAPLSRADSHYLVEGAREGGLIGEARLNCYVRNRRGRLPK